MKRDIMIVSSKEEKSTISCGNNQPCLFNHSVIAHDVAEKILCANSPVKIKEKCTMFIQDQPQPPTDLAEITKL